VTTAKVWDLPKAAPSSRCGGFAGHRPPTEGGQGSARRLWRIVQRTRMPAGARTARHGALVQRLSAVRSLPGCLSPAATPVQQEEETLAVNY